MTLMLGLSMNAFCSLGLIVALFSVCLVPFSGLQTQFYPSTAKRLRCIYRFTSAKLAHSR